MFRIIIYSSFENKKTPEGDDINYNITYENDGRTVTITDPLGRESKVYKNDYGRVWKEEDAAGNITECFYVIATFNSQGIPHIKISSKWVR
jgi:YD repeat-containing protein